MAITLIFLVLFVGSFYLWQKYKDKDILLLMKYTLLALVVSLVSLFVSYVISSPSVIKIVVFSLQIITSLLVAYKGFVFVIKALKK